MLWVSTSHMMALQVVWGGIDMYGYEILSDYFLVYIMYVKFVCIENAWNLPNCCNLLPI